MGILYWAGGEGYYGGGGVDVGRWGWNAVELELSGKV